MWLRHLSEALSLSKTENDATGFSQLKNNNRCFITIFIPVINRLEQTI